MGEDVRSYFSLPIPEPPFRLVLFWALNSMRKEIRPMIKTRIAISFCGALASPDVGAEPGSESGFFECSCGEAEDRLGGGLLGGCEPEVIQFEEQNAYDKSGALIAVNKRMVQDNAGDVGGSHLNDVRLVAIGEELLWTGERGLKQAAIAESGSATFEGEEAIVECERVALVDPEESPHLARTCKVLRKRRKISSAFCIFFSNAGS